MTRLVLENVRINLDGRSLLVVSSTITPEAPTTLMGPSGSGKSSLLNWIIGLLPPAFEAYGRVLIDNQDVTALAPERRRIGVLFQDDLLFPHLSTAQNLMFALPPSVRPRSERRRRAEAALAEMGLAGFGDRDPATLSGGQRARAALARTLLSEPRALLLDEPFSKLDQHLRDQVRALVFGKARERGLPVLLVTHDPADAEAAGGPIIKLCA